MSDQLRVELRPDATDELTALLRERIVILDGAMGTAIQRDRPSEAGYRGERFADWPTDLQGNNDLLSLTQPEIIATIHREYLQAGADIIETNTFNATAISLGDYGLEDLAYEINLESARLARRVCDEVSAQTPGPPRGTSPAPWGPPPVPRPSRPTSTTPAPATCPTTSWSRRTPTPAAAWSTAVPTSSSSRRSSTPSTPRRRSSPSRRCSRTTAAGGR